MVSVRLSCPSISSTPLCTVQPSLACHPSSPFDQSEVKRTVPAGTAVAVGPVGLVGALVAVGILAAEDPQAAKLASEAITRISGRMCESRRTLVCEVVNRERIILVP